MTIIRKRIIFEKEQLDVFDEYGVDVEEQALKSAVRMMSDEIKDLIHISPLTPDDRSIWVATINISE